MERKVKPLQFDNTCTLKDILNKIHNGDITLPFFQRDFEWSTKNMKSLLASLLLGLPIGSILVLKDNKNQFVSRDIEGVKRNSGKSTEFLLDGQQRLTSLYSIFNLVDKDITNKTSITQRWFVHLELFDQEFCANEPFQYSFDNIEPEKVEDFFITKSNTKNDKVFFLDEDDCEFIEACQKEFIFPLDLLFINEDEDEEGEKKKTDKLFEAIISQRRAVWQAKNVKETEKELFKKSYEWRSNVENYLISILEDAIIPVLRFEHGRFNRAIQAFEILNKSGVKLHLFDLLVARAARVSSKNKSNEDNIYQFYDSVQKIYDYEISSDEIKKIRPQYSGCKWSLSSFENNSSFPSNKMKDFLVNILTLLISDKIEKKPSIYKNGNHKINKTILNNFLFSLDDIQFTAQILNNTIYEAMERLQRTILFLNIRCGIRHINDIHYKLIILPIVYSLTYKVWSNKKKLDIIEAWYWSTILTGKYEYNQSIVTIEEIINLNKLLSAKKKQEVINIEKILEKDEVTIYNYQYDRIDYEYLSNCFSSHGFYKTILQFVLSKCPRDFLFDKNKLTAWNTNSNNYNDHHIITLNSEKKISQSTKDIRKDKSNKLNSILNRTLISKESNQKIGGMLFSKYRDEIKNIVFSDHCIDGDELPLINNNELNEDKLEIFLQRRYKLIKKEIQVHVDNLIS